MLDIKKLVFSCLSSYYSIWYDMIWYDMIWYDDMMRFFRFFLTHYMDVDLDIGTDIRMNIHIDIHITEQEYL